MSRVLASIRGFLTPEEVFALQDHALQHSERFQPSRVIAPSEEHSRLDPMVRKTFSLPLMKAFHSWLNYRLRAVFPWIAWHLGVDSESFDVFTSELTLTPDGGRFRRHNDSSHRSCQDRVVSAVIFLHREPREFEGGQLIIYSGNETHRECERIRVNPTTGMLVAFRSADMHEVAPVSGGNALLHSRLTLTVFISRAAPLVPL